ncbi:MAG: hypothetical protein LC749_22825, partial [Actinobacteria bacterium]|nr:hypothetical protein [Actinomycetota bacterium]
MVGKTILGSGNALVRRARFGLVALAATALVATATVLPAAATTTTPVQVLGPPSLLYAVACATPTTCYAVGFGMATEIIPITNGVAGAPTEFASGYGFYDVVCPSATTCVVYGGYTPP